MCLRRSSRTWDDLGVLGVRLSSHRPTPVCPLPRLGRQCPLLCYQWDGLRQAALACGGQVPRRAAHPCPVAASAADVPAGRCDRTRARAAGLRGSSGI
eukprot:2889510-Pyramimonas_sp.AAC.1